MNWDVKYGDAVSGMQAAMQKVDEIIMRNNLGIKIEHVGQSHDDYYQILRAAVIARISASFTAVLMLSSTFSPRFKLMARIFPKPSPVKVFIRKPFF